MFVVGDITLIGELNDGVGGEVGDWMFEGTPRFLEGSLVGEVVVVVVVELSVESLAGAGAVGVLGVAVDSDDSCWDSSDALTRPRSLPDLRTLPLAFVVPVLDSGSLHSLSSPTSLAVVEIRMGAGREFARREFSSDVRSLFAL